MVRLKPDPAGDLCRKLSPSSIRQESSVGSGFSQTWSNQ